MAYSLNGMLYNSKKKNELEPHGTTWLNFTNSAQNRKEIGEEFRPSI